MQRFNSVRAVVTVSVCCVSICTALFSTTPASGQPLQNGLLLWFDAHDPTTILDGAGRNANDGSFDANDVQTWKDKALGNGAQDATLIDATPFTYTASGPFNGAHLNSNGSNALEYPDVNASGDSTTIYVMSTERTTSGVTSLAMQYLDGKGVIVYDGASGVSSRELMVGFRGAQETYSSPNMFVGNQPVIATWSYDGGTKTDVNSYDFRRNPGANGQVANTFEETDWGPVNKNNCCIGGASTASLIGRENAPGGIPLDWAAVLIYDRQLNETEMTQVMGALGTQYGIPSIPEPSSAMLMVLGGFFLVPWNRRRHR